MHGDFGEKVSELRDSRDDLDSDEDRELIEQIDAVLEKYRRDTLQLGAAGQMVLSGEITDIRPSESLEAYEDANPFGRAGRESHRAATGCHCERGMANSVVPTT